MATLRPDPFTGFAISALIVILAGCKPADKPVQAWIPRSVGGPIEIRTLPPAKSLANDYQQWVGSSSNPKVLLYQITLQDSNSQSAFHFEVRNARTPVGKHETTFASFIYTDPTNGAYQLEWNEIGAHSPNLLKVGREQKKSLLQPIQVMNTSVPRLQIVAIEGTKRSGVLVAHTNIVQ